GEPRFASRGDARGRHGEQDHVPRGGDGPRGLDELAATRGGDPVEREERLDRGLAVADPRERGAVAEPRRAVDDGADVERRVARELLRGIAERLVGRGEEAPRGVDEGALTERLDARRVDLERRE